MATMAKCISFYHWIPRLLDGKLCQHEEHHQLLSVVVKEKRESFYISFHYDHPNNVIRNILNDIFDKEPSSGLE